MRYLTIVAIAIFCSGTAWAQTYELGLIGGGLNYIGDVGSTNYIDPNTAVLGGIFKWNRSKRHSFRASLMAGNIEADDLDSDDLSRQARGYSFDSFFIEGSLGLEYTFWEFDLHDDFSLPAAPYLFTGFNAFAHDIFIVRQGQLIDDENAVHFSIPIVLGFKAAVSKDFVLAAEIGARYTFTDSMDGSTPNPIAFGNPNTNDWYMFSGITITYTFGRRPCYCNF
ncbi:MAG: DUF6089 family protein [Leeuwenhoekiella sp.]